MKPNAAQLRELRRENLRWPVELRPVPEEGWLNILDDRDRGHLSWDCHPLGVWRSRQFIVVLWHEMRSGFERLSIQRTEWDEKLKRFRDGITWDELQRLKHEAGFGDRWAVELFPTDDQTVNVANMRHVWLLDGPPAFAWKGKK